jgi:hypothetical protein
LIGLIVLCVDLLNSPFLIAEGSIPRRLRRSNPSGK